jgi:hypothetical protein
MYLGYAGMLGVNYPTSYSFVGICAIIILKRKCGNKKGTSWAVTYKAEFSTPGARPGCSRLPHNLGCKVTGWQTGKSDIVRLLAGNVIGVNNNS